MRQKNQIAQMVGEALGLIPPGSLFDGVLKGSPELIGNGTGETGATVISEPEQPVLRPQADSGALGEAAVEAGTKNLPHPPAHSQPTPSSSLLVRG